MKRKRQHQRNQYRASKEVMTLSNNIKAIEKIQAICSDPVFCLSTSLLSALSRVQEVSNIVNEDTLQRMIRSTLQKAHSKYSLNQIADALFYSWEDLKLDKYIDSEGFFKQEYNHFNPLMIRLPTDFLLETFSVQPQLFTRFSYQIFNNVFFPSHLLSYYFSLINISCFRMKYVICNQVMVIFQYIFSFLYLFFSFIFFPSPFLKSYLIFYIFYYYIFSLLNSVNSLNSFID